MARIRVNKKSEKAALDLRQPLCIANSTDGVNHRTLLFYAQWQLLK